MIPQSFIEKSAIMNSTIERIAILGSAFNPPSLGHKSVIDELTHFDRIFLVPSIAHAWGKPMLDYDARCQLLEAFTQDLNNPKVSCVYIEQELWKPNHKVTTYQVLTGLQQAYPQAKLTFVIGPDNLMRFSEFAQAEQITRAWSILACPETVPIRSSLIRERLEHQQSIADLTTPTVAQLLAQHRYYV